MNPLDDLDRCGHLARKTDEDYQFLIASGESHDAACRRLGLEPEAYTNTLLKRAERAA